jgi:hypothetical protein
VREEKSTYEKWRDAWNELESYVRSLPRDKNVENILDKMKELRPRLSLWEYTREKYGRYDPNKDPAVLKFRRILRGLR